MTTSKSQNKKIIEDLIQNIDFWLDENKAFFNPFLISDKDTTFLYRKSYCEYSLYLHVCQNHSLKANSKLAEKQFFEILHSNKFISLAMRNKDLFMAFGLPIAVANNQNLANDKLQKYFETGLNSSHTRSLELVPFRMMDYLFAAQIYGTNEHVYPPQSLYRLSNYCRHPDPIHADESQTYALTHNVFYLTGMRAKHDFFGVGLDMDNGADKVIEALLLKYLSKQDLDVSIELLASLALLGKCKKWHLELVLADVLKVLEDGCIIPGPLGRMGDDVKTAHGERFFSWAKNYHTMLVAAMGFRIVYDQLEQIEQTQALEDFSIPKSLGHLQRLASEYNLPLLLTVLKSLECEHQSIKAIGLDHVVRNINKFVNEQRSHSGDLGYFHDEKLKFDGGEGRFSQTVINVISKIDKCVDWESLEAF
jgi:hypothetical protein